MKDFNLKDENNEELKNEIELNNKEEIKEIEKEEIDEIDEIYNKNNFRENNPFLGKKNKNKWTDYYEKIFVDWSDKAMSYRCLHNSCYDYYYKLHVWFTIPVIFISTLTGVANFAQDRIDVEYQFFFTMGIGAFNILAGFITTVSQFLKVNELSEGHRISSISWDKLYRNIRVELSKNPNDRENIYIFLEKTKEQYDVLIETSPVIRLKAIQDFNKKFKNFDFNRPEVCNSLISLKETMYKPQIKKEEEQKLKNIINEKKINSKNNYEISKFINKYKEDNKREPSVEEIYDNLEDTINKKYIDKFVQNLYKRINKKFTSSVNNSENETISFSNLNIIDKNL